MKYEFKCKCGAKKTIKMPMKDVKNSKIFCDICGEQMTQDWSSHLIVPDYMKAEETQEMSWVKDRMKNRPSGKRKIYY